MKKVYNKKTYKKCSKLFNGKCDFYGYSYEEFLDECFCANGEKCPYNMPIIFDRAEKRVKKILRKVVKKNGK